ncbi:MAG TPA: formyltransferase family protein [Gemmatimonadota bacterium]|nr:formyltransferase family protein [Gemmatimonadota bacterium]
MTGPDRRGDLGRPIRVVLIRGRFQPRAAQRFYVLLDQNPEIELVGCLCQSAGEGLAERLRDAWRRRGVLAAPILASQAAGAVGRFVLQPRLELGLRRRLAAIDRRTELVPDVHAPTVLERVRRLDPDLGVIYGGPILRPELFEIPRFGTLSIHHGRLPEYRGRKTTFWEMDEGRPTAGVAVQRIGAGLDTGDIMAEGAVAIGDKSYLRVWREVQDLGVTLYLDAILQIKRGTASPRPQTGRPGRLYRDPSWLPVLRLGWRQMRKRWGPG